MVELTYQNIVDTLIKKISSEFKVKETLSESSDVLALKLDSLDVMSYLFFIEETYDVIIPDEFIEDGSLLVIGRTANYILERKK